MRPDVGSSPRARGTGGDGPRHRGRERFIPACAGNRVGKAGGGAVVGGSSPRARGTGSIHSGSSSAAVGSSPRARGTGRETGQRAAPCRFIPACAGNRHVTLIMRVVCFGSSPRARGTGRCGRREPAARPVHPRVRGEQDENLVDARRRHRFIPACAGNRHLAEYVEARRRRFIPACAGNRRSRATMSSLMTVHPRVRGEQAELSIGHGGFWRFIPACAGNRPSASASAASHLGSSPRARGTAADRRSWRRDCPVHPRVRGEQPRNSRDLVAHGGSSPRARGTVRRSWSAP